jgi:predicted permease
MQQVEVFAQDLRYAARSLWHNRVFTAAALFAIALGVGSSTAVFSVVDRILFRSLPYPHDDRLVSFGIVAPIVPQEFMLGYDYVDWRERQIPFEALGSWSGVNDCDLMDSDPVRLRCASADSSLLPALGIEPFMGRNFTAEEDRPNGPGAALISHALWRNRFNGDPGILGRRLRLDGQSPAVVGVLPPRFELPALAAVDLLLPQALDVAAQRTRKIATLLYTVARLKPGVTIAQAHSALEPLFQESLQFVSPQLRKDVKLRIRSLRDRQVQEARLASWILLASVLAVALIACANVANLLLARGAARQRELAVRAVLGAGRGRLVRQTLTESALLGLAGGAAGCAVAFVLMRVFVAIAPAGIPRLHQAAMDLRVLAFTFALSLVCGMLFGAAPARQSVRAETLTGTRVSPAGGNLLRQGLVAAQICVSLVLLTGACSLLRSLWTLQNQPLGIQPANVLTASINLGRHSYSAAPRRLAFFEQLEERLRRISGVMDVAIADSLPPIESAARSVMYAAIDVEGRPRSEDTLGGRAASRLITPGYFPALGIPILRGRGFQEEDRDPNQNVVIVSDRMARRMFPGEDPLGKQIRPGRVGPWLTVVGVVGNVKNNGLADREDPEYYVPRKRSGPVSYDAAAIMRSPADPGRLATVVRAEIGALDPALPVSIEPLERRISQLAQRPRFNAVVLGIFAGMGLILAATGIGGVMSYLVVQRTREIGVRMALGSTPGAISRLILKRAVCWIAAGSLLGLIGSLFANRLLRSMMFRISPNDPWTFALALSILLVCALAAAWIPARRAARVDPMQALREE